LDEGDEPHHSIAILTSERAPIPDSGQEAYYDLESQRREIGEMEILLRELAE
jgi:hypothetical protein